MSDEEEGPMGRWTPLVFIPFLLVVASLVWSQSIVTDGNIETDGQVVSNVPMGTAPLGVSATDRKSGA